MIKKNTVSRRRDDADFSSDDRECETICRVRTGDFSGPSRRRLDTISYVSIRYRSRTRIYDLRIIYATHTHTSSQAAACRTVRVGRKTKDGQIFYRQRSAENVFFPKSIEFYEKNLFFSPFTL